MEGSSGNEAGGSWARLPAELLLSIMLLLNIGDYAAFSAVCKPWSEVATGGKEDFMNRQEPLVAFRRRDNWCVWFLKNVFGGVEYNTMLPDMTGRRLLGSSCGFLIIHNEDSTFWLLNPFTRRELRFPVAPTKPNLVLSYDRIRFVLFYSTQVSDYFAIIVCGKDFIFLSRNGGGRWKLIHYMRKFVDLVIADINIMKGKIFVLTTKGTIGELQLDPEPIIEMYQSGNNATRDASLHLVTMKEDENERLFMVWFHSPFAIDKGRLTRIFELDETTNRWIQVFNLGDKALFLCYVKGPTIVNSARWGGLSNVVYLLEPRTSRRRTFGLNPRRGLLESQYDPGLMPYFWYYPPDCCHQNRVTEPIGWDELESEGEEDLIDELMGLSL